MLNETDGALDSVLGGFWLGLAVLTHFFAVLFTAASVVWLFLVYAKVNNEGGLWWKRLVRRTGLLGLIALGVDGYALMPFLVSVALGEGKTLTIGVGW